MLEFAIRNIDILTVFPSLARSLPKPLKVPSLARSVPKPLKVPSLARSVPKPLRGSRTCQISQGARRPRQLVMMGFANRGRIGKELCGGGIRNFVEFYDGWIKKLVQNASICALWWSWDFFFFPKL